jgi:hypothetical protein
MKKVVMYMYGDKRDETIHFRAEKFKTQQAADTQQRKPERVISLSERKHTHGKSLFRSSRKD